MIGAHFVVVCDYKLTCFHGVWRGPLRGMFMDNSPVFLRLLLIVQYNAKERRYYAADMDSLNGIFVVEDDGMIRLEPLVWRPIHVGVRVAAAVASDWGRKGGGCRRCRTEMGCWTWCASGLIEWRFNYPWH